jgi:hypothetical protein
MSNFSEKLNSITNILGLGASYSSSVGVGIGATGYSGHVGQPGNSDEFKEYLFLCKKDIGFFKNGDYIKMLIQVNSLNYTSDLHILLKSIDGEMSFIITLKQLRECFLFNNELRDKHLQDILKNES